MIHFKGAQALFDCFAGDATGFSQIAQSCDNGFGAAQFEEAIVEVDGAGPEESAEPFFDVRCPAATGGPQVGEVAGVEFQHEGGV